MSEFHRALEKKEELARSTENDRILEQAIAGESMQRQEAKRQEEERLKKELIQSGTDPRMILGDEAHLLIDFWQHMQRLGNPGAETHTLRHQIKENHSVRKGIFHKRTMYQDVTTQPEIKVSAYAIGMVGISPIITCEDGRLRMKNPYPHRASLLVPIDSNNIEPFVPGIVKNVYQSETSTEYIRDYYKTWTAQTLAGYSFEPSFSLAETLADIVVSNSKNR